MDNPGPKGMLEDIKKAIYDSKHPTPHSDENDDTLDLEDDEEDEVLELNENLINNGSKQQPNFIDPTINSSGGNPLASSNNTPLRSFSPPKLDLLQTIDDSLPENKKSKVEADKRLISPQTAKTAKDEVRALINKLNEKKELSAAPALGSIHGSGPSMQDFIHNIVQKEVKVWLDSNLPNWIDKNLPEMIREMIQSEIKKLISN